MQVYHDQDALHRAVNDIRTFKGEVAGLLKAAGGQPGSASLTAEGNSLVQRASQIEAVLMQASIKGSEANLNYPGMLNEQIYSFAGLLNDADTAPNTPEVQTYAGLHARLEAQLAEWAKLKKTGIAGFCSRVQAAGQSGTALSSCQQ